MAISTAGVSGSYVTRITPLGNVQPFTYRDSMTFQELLYSYKEWINSFHIPELNVVFQQLVDQVNAALTDNATIYQDGIQEFQRIHDAYVADVSASIAQLSDPQIKLLVENSLSETGKALRTLFASSAELATQTNTVNAALTAQSTAVDNKISQFTTDNAATLQASEARSKSYVDAHQAVLYAADYGVIGDGVVDDTGKLRAALSAASAARKPLVLPTASNIKITDRILLPSNITLYGQDSVILADVSSAFYPIHAHTVNNVVLKDFTLRIIPGTNMDRRGISFYRVNNGVIDNVIVESTVSGTGATNGYYNALYLADSKNCRVTNSTFRNFDYNIQCDIGSNIFFDNNTIEGYRTGLWVKNVSDSVFSNTTIKTASVNADALPGHNSILVEATQHGYTNNVVFENIQARDAGEHGIRLGGQFRISNIIFNNCHTFNSGRCGFKVLGGTLANANYHTDLTFNDCGVVDAGQVSTNAAAFMIQMAKRVNVINPRVKSDTKSNSCADGFNIQGVDTVNIINPYLTACMNNGIIIDANLGNVTEVIVDGGYISSPTGHGINIQYTDITLRRIRVKNFPEIQQTTGYAFRITNTGTGVVSGVSELSVYIPTSSPGVIDPISNTARFMAEIKAAFEPTLDPGFFYNGSTWVDLRTSGMLGRAVKSGGVWKWL